MAETAPLPPQLPPSPALLLVESYRLVQLAKPLFVPLIRYPHQIIDLLQHLIIHHPADILTQLFIVLLDGLSDHLGEEILKLFRLSPGS